jgi:hypothetical protein
MNLSLHRVRKEQTLKLKHGCCSDINIMVSATFIWLRSGLVTTQQLTKDDQDEKKKKTRSQTMMGAWHQETLADWPSIIIRLWLCHSETEKYGRESRGTWTRDWMHWRGPAVIVKCRPSFPHRGCSHQQTRDCSTGIKVWSLAPDGCLTPREGI